MRASIIIMFSIKVIAVLGYLTVFMTDHEYLPNCCNRVTVLLEYLNLIIIIIIIVYFTEQSFLLVCSGIT